MITERFGVIVPSSDENRYSKEGDLAKFGDTSLLEWKLNQLTSVFPKKNIYISTSSKKILMLADRLGINKIERASYLSLEEIIVFSVSQVNFENIVWTNVTSPFLGPTKYLQMIKEYLSLASDKYSSFDCMLAAERLSEYFYYKGVPLNFDSTHHISRTQIEPLFKVTNGCAIINKSYCLKIRKYHGNFPLFHEVDRLSALEIKDFEYLHIASELISVYF